ncbi:BTAD domain-containing putative transcriptional regulator [Streptomyces luomodiensis]|uniref:BTAD domain-containing putative transcriptional regulator n=1 Tax=Streptomyces luomodiensis TaxID=3026192 RepID=A0ABY9USK5_9ACTN|nr:BTAD domain-containing putative transcriptional regulator [Streptomyces sp. SCA4-21]WNE95537.1 BTAD domain-containing putative transcriptional regulator [Streptomyces sp. SCA4-21]
MAYRSSPKARLEALLVATATGVVTLALLAGMPYVLWHATGVPWPDRVGSWHDLSAWLMQPVTDPLMVDLLAMVGWVCWTAFAWSLLTEAAWYALHLPHLLRDRTAHKAHLETLPVQRALAALCIGTLALAVISLWRPPAANAHQHTPADGGHAHITATAPAHAGSTKDEPHTTRTARSTQARGVEYTVAHGDTLWDIAETHLDDPLKWPRIYALNKTRIQADGQRLTDPDQLTPGWQLTIPTTPSPNPLLPTPHPTPAQPSSPPTPTAPLPADPTPGHRAEHDTASRATRDHTTNHTRPGPAAISVGPASMIGITTAAGLLAALRFFRFYQHRSRRHSLDAQPPPLSPVIEKAVMAAREAALPRSTAADPDRLITRRTPPQPPQPASTVTIGTANASEISLDALAGGCAWTGPGAEAAARALMIGILTAAERLRPRTPRVRGLLTQNLTDRLLPGTPPHFSALASAEDLNEAIRRAEAHLLAHARHHQDTQEAEHGPLPATTDGSGEPSGPGTLVLLSEPNTAQSSYLATLASREPHGALIVLALGDLPGTAAWRIEADGTVNQQTGAGDCASTLQLFHLTPQAGQDVLDMLLTAHDKRPRTPVLPGARAAADPTQHPAEDADHDPEDDPPPAPPEPVKPVKAREANQDKPVRLNVLGPVTLYAHGNPEPVGLGLRGEVREFLALLAAHPTGLITDDIARHLRLSEDPDQSAKELKNLRRAVRRALRSATGHSKAEFIQLHGELHKLHTGLIETDLAAFTEALHHAATAPDGPPRLTALHHAVDLYRGPFAHGGDYPWCDSIRESLASKAADAVAHIAHHAEHAGTRQDADAALALLEKAITLSPTHELLYQHAIRLHQVAGRHDTARNTFTLLERNLKVLGLAPDPATRALLTIRTRTAHLG